jgi:K+-sensing histidine kinase KdpD
MVFTHELNQLKYHSSKVRGISVLDEKVRKDFKNYVIGSESQEYRELSKGNPILTAKPQFGKVLEKLNITAYYALVPIVTKSQMSGLLVVGNFGSSNKLVEQDLEKLTLLCNMVALKLENLESFKNLFRSIQQRTEELETANKLLAESIIERDNMLKLVSHDMNAPLRNVLGLVDSIHRKYADALPEDVMDRIDRIRNNVDKERQMIKDVLLNFRAFESSSSDENIDMRDLLLSIKEELQHELEKKSIELYIPDTLPVIKAKRHLVRHIFLNLVDNASKYLPEDRKGNHIRIDANESIDEVTYSVSDNGKGIPQDKQLDIFLSYKSLEGLHEVEFSGLGLGLALVKNIVEKMSGKIWIKSKMGEGTTFFVSLRKSKFEHISKNQV